MSASAPTVPQLLDRKEAAAFLHISEWALHQFLHREPDDNPLPVRRAGRKDLFLPADLLEWTAREEARTDRASAKERARVYARERAEARKRQTARAAKRGRK